MGNIATAPPGLVVTYKGETVPVTNMMDARGDDTDFIHEAVKIIAGPMRDGTWLTSTVRPGDIRRVKA